MRSMLIRTVRVSALLSVAGALALPAFALAQEAKADPQGAKEDYDKDIVVTGTLIRGQALTGGQLETVTVDDIRSLGVADTSQLLGSLPQDAQFNGRPQVGSFGPYQTVNSPILRYLGGGASGNNSTLLLVDGHRLPGMGIQQTSSDMDAIPLGAIQQVDIAPDGGSATYGADAVGGVVNLITRKRFNGFELGGHYGQADDYNQWDVNTTVGKEWSTGSIWLAYNYAQHSMLRNSNRDYDRDLDYTTTPYSLNDLRCSPGNFVAGGYVAIPTPPYYALVTTTYPVVNGAPVAGAPNKCDLTQSGSMLPSERRHSAMAGLDVDLADWISADIKAFYMRRDARNDGGPLPYIVATTACTGGADICAGPYAPFFTSSGNAYGNMSGALGTHSYGKTRTEAWGVTPTVTVKLGADWQMTAFYSYGEGVAQFISPSLDLNQLAAQTASGAFNPFTGQFANTAAGAAALAYQSNYRGFSSGKDTISNGRVVFDGPLLALPGGDVRVAVGGELLHEDFEQRNGNALASDLGSIVPNRTSRGVKSVFGELSVPIVGEGNSMPGIHSLTLSAAGRYDKYSDFGDTFNPKLGATWKPTSWWSIRGNWGKSYQAPSLASKAETIPVTLNVIPAGIFGGNPAYPETTGKFILLLYPGGGIDLKPQKATTWQIGTDITPDAIPGVSLSATYYNIDFKDRIGFPSFFSPSFYSLYPDSYVMNTAANPLTSQQIADYVSVATPGSFTATNAQFFIDNPDLVYALENGLSQNLARTKTSGIDFSLDYRYRTGFGSIFAGVAGTYVLTYKTQATPTGPFQGLDANSTQRLRTSTTLGANIGDFLAKATWNRSDGFAVMPTAGNDFQERVKAFNVVNLAFQYSPNGGGAFDNTTFTLNIDNVFDTDPPAYRGSFGAGKGYYGFTIGRFVQLGVSKKF